jgi:hypothetical protein
MPLVPKTGFGLGSSSGLVSSVRPSGMRGIREQNARWVGRSYTLRCERVLVLGRPLRLARMRCERESVGVVCPPGLPNRQPDGLEVL